MAGKRKKDKVQLSLPLLEAHRSRSGADLVVKTSDGVGSVVYGVTVVDLDVQVDGGFVAIVQGKGATRVVGRLREEIQTREAEGGDPDEGGVELRKIVRKRL